MIILYHHFKNYLSIDWVALSALIISVVSVVIAVSFNRKTLKMTEKHNKKSVEPLITDTYFAQTLSEKGKNSSVSYKIKNCGLGPAIIKNINYRIKDTDNKSVFIIYESNISPINYIYDLSLCFLMDKSHALASTESLELFNLYFRDFDSAEQFHNLIKNTEFSLDYETIYGEKRFFKKDKLSIV